jgi:predicted pyridoxine 5'-phosphate oxidase superfamily flavin-nucleotide-binding protein
VTYHPGSRAVQERVGVRDLADHVGQSVGQGIRPVAAAFLEQQPMLVLGAADPVDGAVWASPVTGRPGFVRATGPRRISVAGSVRAGDPIEAALSTEGTAVGTLALDPRTRRRMRLNGRARPTPGGLAVEADQVFANCPKYLQRRQTYETLARTPRETGRGTELTPEQREFVTAADTFFLASVHADGADVSHRGGNPGFVHAGQEATWRRTRGPDCSSWTGRRGRCSSSRAPPAPGTATAASGASTSPSPRPWRPPGAARCAGHRPITHPPTPPCRNVCACMRSCGWRPTPCVYGTE